MQVGLTAKGYPLLAIPRAREDMDYARALMKKKKQVYVTDEMNEISPAMLKALLQTVGLITCLPNQEVKISVLDDSNFVTAMMYILSIVFCGPCSCHIFSLGLHQHQ